MERRLNKSKNIGRRIRNKAPSAIAGRDSDNLNLYGDRRGGIKSAKLIKAKSI